MAKGKFSNPRPYRDEERQIEETFRQLTGKENAARVTPQPKPQRQTRAEAQVQAKQRRQNPSPEQQTPGLAENQLSEQPQASVFEEAALYPPIPDIPAEEAFEKPFEDSFDLNFDNEEPFREEDQPDVPEDFLDKAMAFFNQNRKYVLACLCAAALLLIVGVIAIFAAGSSDPYDGKILDNVYIGDIHVGGMTKNEAVSAVTQSTSGTYVSLDMVIDLSGTELRLTPKDTGAELDAKAAVSAAYDYGRTGTQAEREQAYESSRSQPYIIGMLPYLTLDEEFILNTLTAYAEDAGSTLTQTCYGLEGIQPALDAENFNESAPGQTLVITMGTPGVGFDVNDVYEQVLDAYSLHTFLVEVENVESVKDPDPVDLEAIYEEFYIAPIDATVDLQNYEVIPGSYGYGFDLEAAQTLVDNAEFGEILRIPMEYIEPAILDEDMFFRDVLGSCETPHTNNENRNTNLRLACEAINGLVLNPGETFSYNDTLGERTAAKGYKNAPSYSGNELVDTIGGGICQVSSTLYKAALLADMEIVYRVNHGFAPNYIDFGMDATVSWKSTDFQFANNTSFPVQIAAEVSGGKVNIQILGTDERDYYVEMDHEITNTYKPETQYEDFEFDNAEGYEDGDVIQKGVTGYQVKTYKYKYDKATGELISKDFVATSRYTTVNEIIARVEKPVETTAPETEPETTPPPETTVPPTTQTPAEPPETLAPTVPTEIQPTEKADPAPEQETQSEEQQPVSETDTNS